MSRRVPRLAVVSVLLVIGGGCARPPGPSESAASAAPAPAKFADEISGARDEDYAKARAAFESKVTWNGHAPVAARVTKEMRGADVLPYSSGGLELRAFVTPDPGDGKKHPAVVFLAGGFNLDQRAWNLALDYGKAGFVAMAPMPRGENLQKGIYTMFYRETDDVLAATEQLAKLPYVDGSRVFLAGVDEGGTQALLCALASDRYKAVAAVNPVLDIASFTKVNRYLVGFDRKDVREFQLRSPLAYATSLKCPARLYVNAGDSAAEAAAGEFEKRAKGKGLDAEAEAVPVPKVPPARKGDSAAKKGAAAKKGGPPRPPTIDAEAVRRSIEFFRAR